MKSEARKEATSNAHINCQMFDSLRTKITNRREFKGVEPTVLAGFHISLLDQDGRIYRALPMDTEGPLFNSENTGMYAADPNPFTTVQLAAGSRFRCKAFCYSCY